MTKSADDSGKQTVELPAVTPDDLRAADAVEAPAADVDSGAADPVSAPAADAETRTPNDAPEAFLQEERESGPAAEMSGPAIPARPSGVADGSDGAADKADAADLDATVQRARVEAPAPERPRHNTLASITRPRGGTNPQGAPLPPPPPAHPTPPAEPASFSDDAIPDESEGAGDDEAEWEIADQPTVSLSPGAVLGARPQFLDTNEQSVWPPRHPAELPIPGSLPEAAASLRRRAIPRLDRTGQRRLASPTGRPMPDTPPYGTPRGAIPDPRMERLRELNRRRDTAEQGEYDPNADRHVADRVRQWWGDLRPGLKQALDYQHEARASGVHPIPVYEPAPPTSRLGDVFGRLTASARELTGRAQSAAAPALRKLHDQAEHAAQAIVGRFEGDPVRQQAPFLGPGRIAVFFRSGVSVGQAQRLLSSLDARPLRIIPRKHGFLAYVLPGTEEQVSKRLRVHPYIRDVVFMPTEEYGDSAREDEEY